MRWMLLRPAVRGRVDARLACIGGEPINCLRWPRSVALISAIRQPIGRTPSSIASPGFAKISATAAPLYAQSLELAVVALHRSGFGRAELAKIRASAQRLEPDRGAQRPRSEHFFARRLSSLADGARSFALFSQRG